MNGLTGLTIFYDRIDRHHYRLRYIFKKADIFTTDVLKNDPKIDYDVFTDCLFARWVKRSLLSPEFRNVQLFIVIMCLVNVRVSRHLHKLSSKFVRADGEDF